MREFITSVVESFKIVSYRFCRVGIFESRAVFRLIAVEFLRNGKGNRRLVVVKFVRAVHVKEYGGKHRAHCVKRMFYGESSVFLHRDNAARKACAKGGDYGVIEIKRGVAFKRVGFYYGRLRIRFGVRFFARFFFPARNERESER